MRFSLKTLGTRIVLLLLVSSILALHPINHRGEVQVADAAFALEGTQLVNTAMGSISAAMETALVPGKEFGLDFLFFQISKIFLSTMIQSLTNWVNSGFNGAPTFVTDLKEHLINVADEAAAEFLFSEDGLGLTALETLCSPFSLDIQFAITQSAAKRQSEREDGYHAQCSLSDIAGNIENFVQGDFAGGGGWQNWIQMTQHSDQNTSMGAYMTAQSKLFEAMNEREGNEIHTLNFGQGFLSMKDENGRITTPGTVIAGQINKALGAGQDVLVAADEIDELIGALFYQLVNRVFGSVGGLRGASDDGFFGNNGDDLFGPTIDFDDVYVPYDPDVDPPIPDDPDDPSVDPVDPFTDETLDPVIPGTDDPTVDPVVGDIDDEGDSLPSADPVGGITDPTTDPGDPADPV